MELMTKHLQKTFLERCQINERYSLRAFAKSLDVPVSSLSEVINEKRALSKKLGLKVGKSLKMSKSQLEAFQDFSNKGLDQQQIALDSFYMISEWWHYGILQLLRTDGFKNNPSWVAKRLRINPSQAKNAIERLLRIGILELNESEDLVDTTNGATSHLVSNFTNQQLKDFQIKALEKAILSIKRDPIEFRDNTSMTMAINKDSVAVAKEEIKKFRRRLTKKLEKYSNADEVFQLTIGLNPLSLTTGDNNVK